MNYSKDLKKPIFILAPMDDVTDTVFRQTVASLAAPDLFFTEFVNVDGLQSPGRAKLTKKLQFALSEKSLIAQIWGKNPENFYKTAEQIADGTFARELGLPEGHNFVGVDLNMGCPQKSEVNGGTCSALMNDRPLAHEIILATQQGLKSHLPISIKTRIGYNEIDMTWIEFVLKHELNMLSIHARTKKDMSKVPARWKYFAEILALRDNLSPETLIIGNGDILTKTQGMELVNQYKLDGVMIGRGIFADPFAFSDESPWADYPKHKKIQLYKNQVELFDATWQDGQRPIYTLNKFCKVYINGFNGAKDLREKLMATTNLKELISILNQALQQEPVLSGN
jgi:tRNA-dihydrouridine synthase